MESTVFGSRINMKTKKGGLELIRFCDTAKLKKNTLGSDLHFRKYKI